MYREILNYIGWYIVSGILNTFICPNCIALLVYYLIKNKFDHEYIAVGTNFTISVSREYLT